MKINSMFFIAMCGLCISCGAEITTDTSSEVLSDRQIPIGISTVAVPEYGAETTRGLIANATYQLGLFRTGDKGYPPQYDAPYTYTATGWTASTEVKVSSKSPAEVANIRLTNCFFMIFTLKTIMIQKCLKSSRFLV